jgi:hypothetical protein
MTFTKSDLYKNLRMKVQGKMQNAPVPERFAGAGEKLVQFGAKLPQGLVKQLQAQALIRGVTVSELAARLLTAALGDVPMPALDAVAPVKEGKAVEAKPQAKVAVSKKVAVKKAAVKKAPVKAAPAPKAPAKKAVAAKKPAVKKVAVKKAAVKPAPAKKAAPKPAPAKKAAVKKVAAKKVAAKKAPAKKSPTRKPAA